MIYAFVNKIIPLDDIPDISFLRIEVKIGEMPYIERSPNRTNTITVEIILPKDDTATLEKIKADLIQETMKVLKEAISAHNNGILGILP